MALIVVGVDGSEGSEAALRFAVDEAALRAARLRVVCAWEIPAAVYATTWGLAAEGGDGYGDKAEGIVASALSELSRLRPDVDAESRTAQGQPAGVLLAESQDADLLVIGSRGLGGFKSLMLGSVGQQVAHHASCPVVIVPPPGRRSASTEEA